MFYGKESQLPVNSIQTLLEYLSSFPFHSTSFPDNVEFQKISIPPTKEHRNSEGKRGLTVETF